MSRTTVKNLSWPRRRARPLGPFAAQIISMHGIQCLASDARKHAFQMKLKNQWGQDDGKVAGHTTCCQATTAAMLCANRQRGRENFQGVYAYDRPTNKADTLTGLCFVHLD
ncbi:hypothetical protein AC1031_015669 [Aphanomyces cochlioides]|nr:hypothetical protein AC1031_015669 [Aphanomyces cochlioides]